MPPLSLGVNEPEGFVDNIIVFASGSLNFFDKHFDGHNFAIKLSLIIDTMLNFDGDSGGDRRNIIFTL